MKNGMIVALMSFATLCLLSTKSLAGDNVILAALGEPSSPQIMLAAVAEPRSPVVGKTIQVNNDLRFTIGYRLWLNWWQTSLAKVDTITDPDAPRNQITISSANTPSINQFAAASIPSVGMRYKDFFASASVMISPDYHFPRVTTTFSGTVPFPHSFVTSNRVTASRTEVDVNLGYYIHPWIALTGGYKGVFQEFENKFSATDTDQAALTTVGTTKSSPKYHGGTIGVAANVPIPEAGWIPAGYSLYGNAGGGVMGSNDFPIAFYGTVDVGLAYKPTSLPLILTGGFKYQIINSKTPKGASENHIIDLTRGAIFGLHFVF